VKTPKIPIKDIHIKEDRFRVVDEDEAFHQLKSSIERHGLIQPITVRPDASGKYVLIAGCRRITACKKLKWKDIPCTILTPNRELDSMLIEFEENCHRQDFTWQQEAVACRRMYNTILKKRPKYTAKEFATLVNMSESKLSTLLNLLTYSDSFPKIWIMDKWTKAELELKRLVRASLYEEKLRREKEQQQEILAEMNIPPKPEGHHHKCTCPDCVAWKDWSKCTPRGDVIIHDDALTFLDSLDNKSVDLCVTDPPFGLNIEESRSMEARHHIYDGDDEPNRVLKLMEDTIKLLGEKMQPGAHVYMFFALQYYDKLTTYFLNNKFTLCKVPLLWIKSGGGSTQQPWYYPGNVYEPILMAFAPGERRKLTTPGVSNVFMCDSVLPTKKDHPLEKSEYVYDDLIRRSYESGDFFIDPFCGVGNSLVAARKRGCNVKGAEKVEGYRKIAELKLLELEGDK
jgi:ParB/RepB/Spo0J family partition protein